MGEADQNGDRYDMTGKKNCVAALIVTFNPNERLLLSLENLQSVANHVVIVDNDSSDKSFMDRIKTNFNEKVLTILELSSNLGIAGALNHGVKFIKDNFNLDYILTLDQDTIIVQHDIDAVIRDANQMFDKIGIIALGMNKTEDLIHYREIDYVITSGNLVRVDIFNNLQFREEFFMDQVDFDFDFEVRKLGYRIILADGNLIDHRLGMKFGKLLYEPQFRTYYIIRNSTVLLTEGKLPITNYICQIAYWSLSSLLHDGIVSYSKILIAGLIDAISRNLGKI